MTQCPNKNAPLPSLLRHPPLHQKTLRPDSSKSKQHPHNRRHQTRRHPQHHLLLLKPQLLRTSSLNRIHDPIRFLHLIRHPPRNQLIRAPVLAISIRSRVPLQHAAVCKNMPPGLTRHLPHVPQSARPTASFRSPAAAGSSAAPDHALLRMLSDAK